MTPLATGCLQFCAFDILAEGGDSLVEVHYIDAAEFMHLMTAGKG